MFLKVTIFQKDGVTHVEETKSKIFVSVLLIDLGEALCPDHLHSSLLFGKCVSIEEMHNFIQPLLL